MFLLFCLSLIPFFTAYVGENYMASLPTLLYLTSLLMCGFAFLVLKFAIVSHCKTDPEVIGFGRAAMMKNAVALGLYALGLVAAFYYAIFSLAAALVVGIMYILPDAWISKKKV